jgi:hypothetical protein
VPLKNAFIRLLHTNAQVTGYSPASQQNPCRECLRQTGHFDKLIADEHDRPYHFSLMLGRGTYVSRLGSDGGNVNNNTGRE